MIDVISILTVFLLTFVGTSLLPGLFSTDIVPMLTLFFIISLTYFQKGVSPILIAALAGLLLDFLSVSPFGLYVGLFLVIAVTIRFLFQEGMKEIAFSHYLIISLVSLILFFTTESLILYFTGATVSFFVLAKSFVLFMVTNLFFALLMYFFNTKYFEYFQKFDRRLQ